MFIGSNTIVKQVIKRCREEVCVLLCMWEQCVKIFVFHEMLAKEKHQQSKDLTIRWVRWCILWKSVGILTPNTHLCLMYSWKGVHASWTCLCSKHVSLLNVADLTIAMLDIWHHLSGGLVRYMVLVWLLWTASIMEGKLFYYTGIKTDSK